MTRARQLWVAVHRWTGLALAAFLLMAGLTGSLLAFYHDLDVALGPDLPQAAAPGGQTALDPLVLRERAEAQLPQVEISWLPLTIDPGQPVTLYVAPREGRTANFDEALVDPRTGQVLDTRLWGELPDRAVEVMPFVYRLHYSLALDTVGTYLMGLIALLWTLDCFVGAYLTMPARRAGRQPWLKRWSGAWRVRGRGDAFRLNFDLHRAGGLWLWAMLFVFAWSSVGLNLREVYNPVMGTAFHMADDRRPQTPVAAVTAPQLDWTQAREAGRAAASRLARERGFEVIEERYLGYEPDYGVYQYRVRSSLDIGERYAGTDLWIDGQNGALRAFELPTGQAAGDTITTWLFKLHFADVGGLPYRIFVCLLGLAVAGLSGTGVYIWWRKRSARRKSAHARTGRGRGNYTSCGMPANPVPAE